MKLNYRKTVTLIYPDQGSGFGIVRAVIVAITESSLFNMAFVKAQRQNAGKLELNIAVSHTPSTPRHNPEAQMEKPAMLMAACSSHNSPRLTGQQLKGDTGISRRSHPIPAPQKYSRYIPIT